MSEEPSLFGAMGLVGHAEGVLKDQNGNELDSDGNIIDSNESEGETK